MSDGVALRPEITGISLCSGIGALDLGLRLAIPQYRCVCYVEREAYAAGILVARMEDQALHEAPVWDDVNTFDGRPWRGRVDIIHAGYPCQPWSAAGLRRGKEDPRHLWPDIARIVEEVAPTFVFCENVPPHLRLGFDEVGADMERLGYDVAAGVFTAWGCGAPHIRERLFWLGRRRGAPPHTDGDPLRYLTERGGGRAQEAEQGDAISGDGGEAGSAPDTTGPRREELTRSGSSGEGTFSGELVGRGASDASELIRSDLQREHTVRGEPQLAESRERGGKWSASDAESVAVGPGLRESVEEGERCRRPRDVRREGAPDADGERLEEPRWSESAEPSQAGAQCAGLTGGVADTTSSRGRALGPLEDSGRRSPEGPRGDGDHDLQGAGVPSDADEAGRSELAQCDRLEGVGHGGGQRWEVPRGEREGQAFRDYALRCGLFDWDRAPIPVIVPKEDWERRKTQPVVRGVDDVRSYRVDRLQGLGNAVVPLVVARAFAVLFVELDEALNEEW